MKMKKVLFGVLFLFLCGFLPGQTYLEEDFEQVSLVQESGDIPEGWTLYNDGNRVDQTFRYCDDAWNVVSSDGNQVAVSPSWFTNANARADRWLVSPALDLSQAQEPFLSFRARSFDMGEKESYCVLLSFEGVEKENFTDTLLWVEGEAGTWTKRVADLRAYAGKRVYLAFVQRSLNRYALYLDDIRVSDLRRPQIALSNLQCPDMVEPGEGFCLSVRLETVLDEPLQSCTLAYTIGEADSVASVVLPAGKAEDGNLEWRSMVAVSDTLRLEQMGTYPFKVWVASLNGREELCSDTLSGFVEVSDQGYYPRRTLLEVFSSSTCSPCASANPFIKAAYDAVYAGASASMLSVVKFQMDIPAPGDPCIINEGLYRKELYSVSGIPALFINGEAYRASSGYAGFSEVLATRVESERNRLTPFEIEAEGRRVGTEFQVDVSLTNVVACDGVLLYVVLTEDSIYHEPQSNGEKEFFHVARKVLPSAYGEALDLASSGTREFHYSVDLGSGNPKIFGPWEGVSAVVFVQDARSKEVLQSRSLRFVQESSSESLAERPDIRFNLSPNPCRERCRLEFGLPETSRVRVEILDLSSKVRKQLPAESMSAGTHVLELPVEGLEAGVYLLRIRVGQNVYVKKLVIC